MDRNDSIIAAGFKNHNDAVAFEAEQIRLGTFEQIEIEYKGNVNEIIARSRIRTLYIQIFGKANRVYFKDYVTNESIVVSDAAARLPFGDKYIQTFHSMLGSLGNPSFLIVYKK
jgi:hypothetical protein